MHAFATLVTNADYALGALTLARSLRRTGTEAPLLVLAKPDVAGLEALEAAGAEVVPLAPLLLSDGFRARHGRAAQHRTAPFTKGEKPAFHDPLDNFQKLRLWELERFRRIVFLDADTVVVRAIDKLFGYPEFSAAPNLHATLADMHRLNSGVFVAEPAKATFQAMLEALDRPDVFWRRTDQTFLETWFPDWHGLPYTYNCLQYVYCDLPELWHWPAIKVVHYQYEKPWDPAHPKRDRLAPLIDLWWRLHDGQPPPETLPAGV
ncbi:MAG: glycosyltransferase family 8 protein [Geminicoccaceae bacterium]|nr:MAG: glycosyltransferase family 8 protein [Geminicoccaceae bacterium]